MASDRKSESEGPYIHPELEGEAGIGVGVGLGSALAAPDCGVDFREEHVGILNDGVDVGDVELVHQGHSRAVHGCASHHEAFVLSCSFGLGKGLVEGIDAGDFGNGFAAEVEHYVLAPLQRPERQGEIGGTAHYHGVAVGDGLEVLEVFGDVPGEIALDAYSVIVRNCNDKTLFHIVIF